MRFGVHGAEAGSVRKFLVSSFSFLVGWPTLSPGFGEGWDCPIVNGSARLRPRLFSENSAFSARLKINATA